MDELEAISAKPIKLPDVDRIQSVVPTLYRDAKKSTVELRYTDHKQQLYELTMPLLDALYLLNCLEEMSREKGFDHLRRPPSSSA